MKNEEMKDRVIKRLENEIIALQDEQTALLRRKWRLEDEIRKQRELIKQLEMGEMEAVKGRSAWKRVVALMVAFWALFLSFMGMDRK